MPSEDIWITSKVWPTEYGEGKTLEGIDKMLDRLGVDYIDLLYVHQPVGDWRGAWRDMEKPWNPAKSVHSVSVISMQPTHFSLPSTNGQE